MGYHGEEVAACRQVLDRLDFSRLAPPSAPILWPRNGAVGLAFQCPFVLVSRMVPGSNAWREERYLSLQPVLASAALVTILFLWCSRLASSPSWGFVLALAAAFATMLWPYAYIGLETTQSLFLLLSGFLAIEARGAKGFPTWRLTVLFGACSGIALSAKSGGLLLAPAVALLFWTLFRRSGFADADAKPPRASSLARCAVAIGLAVAIVSFNEHFRALSWRRFGGMRDFARQWLVHDAWSPLLHLIAYFGSPNKGLIVYAPIAILGVVAIPAAFARDRRVALFSLLTLAGIAGSLSFLEMWSDETWGPRYLHSALGPLVLCFAASRRLRPLRARSESPFVAAVILGLGVSFLGAFFYYGVVSVIAAGSAPSTLQALQGDETWNHVRFNARLFDVWVRDPRGRAKDPEYWRPGRLWDFGEHPRELVWTNVDLRRFAKPQAFVFQDWASPRVRLACVASLLIGLGGLTLVGRGISRSRRFGDPTP